MTPSVVRVYGSLWIFGIITCAFAAPSPAATGPLPAPSAGSAGASECCDEIAALGFQSTLPVVVIRTAASNVTKEVRVPMDICTCNNGASFKDYNGTGNFRVRGNSSAKEAKKSYAVKLQYVNGTNENFPFLGMPPEHDWVLYGGDSVDLTSGMRNWIAYNTARASGEYASRTVWSELFLCLDGAPLGMHCHQGLYIGEESVKRDKDRVDVKKWTPEDPSGGYIFVYDNDNFDADEVQVGPLPRMDEPFIVKYPEPETDAELGAAVGYLTTYLSDFQDALFGAQWLEEDRGYAHYLDGPSWIDYFLTVELTKNPDGYRGSTYFHKNRDEPLAAGPVWDYNEAFGICCGFPIEGYDKNGVSTPGVAGGSAISPAGWRFLICADQERCVFDPDDGISSWFQRMWNDTRFRTAAAARWSELRADAWSDEFFTTLIDDAADTIRTAAINDVTLWSGAVLKPWYASPQAQWTSEVAALRTWVLQRVAWMDAALARAGSPDYSYPADNQIAVPGLTNATTPTAET